MADSAVMTPAEAIASLGLTVESVFVPFSRSRNKAEKNPSLNWKVTIKRNDREVLTTDYMAGMGHCPNYGADKAPVTFQPHGYKSHDGKPYKGGTSAYRSATARESLAQYREAIAAAECESGLRMELDQWARGPGNVFKPKMTRQADSACDRIMRNVSSPILPDAESVIYSLTMDSDVLNYGTFEDWAETFGYETDSRSAESTYRACLEIALKLRAAIGESGLETLATAFQDF